MLAQYLDAAMRLAQYEYLTEDGVYYGEIPPLAGVWATGKTLEDCQQELREVLEEWVALRQQWGSVAACLGFAIAKQPCQVCANRTPYRARL
jgi:predicted RNase H-like HicB family nuclease